MGDCGCDRSGFSLFIARARERRPNVSFSTECVWVLCTFDRCPVLATFAAVAVARAGSIDDARGMPEAESDVEKVNARRAVPSIDTHGLGARPPHFFHDLVKKTQRFNNIEKLAAILL